MYGSLIDPTANGGAMTTLSKPIAAQSSSKPFQFGNAPTSSGLTKYARIGRDNACSPPRASGVFVLAAAAPLDRAGSRFGSRRPLRVVVSACNVETVRVKLPADVG